MSCWDICSHKMISSYNFLLFGVPFERQNFSSIYLELWKLSKVRKSKLWCECEKRTCSLYDGSIILIMILPLKACSVRIITVIKTRRLDRTLSSFRKSFHCLLSDSRVMLDLISATSLVIVDSSAWFLFRLSRLITSVAFLSWLRKKSQRGAVSAQVIEFGGAGWN